MPESINDPVAAFVLESGVQKILDDLRKDFDPQQSNGKELIVSDVWDKNGNQYIDLVQQGGGVWGIALLGFTYILEKMKIRFFSVAGTSAGAINTMFLAAGGKKEEERVEKIIAEFLKLDMFTFVDGKPGNWRLTQWIKRIIQKFIVRLGYIKRLQNISSWLLLLFVFFSLNAFIATFFIPDNYAKYVAVFAIVIWLVVLTIVLFLKNRITILTKNGYGLNAGIEFHKWVEGILNHNGIYTLADLKKSFSQVPSDLYVRPDKARQNLLSECNKPDSINSITDTITQPVSNEGIVDDPLATTVSPPNNPMLVIISSDITTGNKIEFPRMWDLYWDSINSVNPADFVRASMSIPVFFRTYKIPVQKYNEEIWKGHLSWNGEPPKEIEFVDGGALSNFPINVFYNPDFIVPRMPTFGIRLGNGTKQIPNKNKSIGEYIGSIISTIRSNTDKDFINKNKAFEIGVKEVDLTGHSWLNFFMKDKEKKDIFYMGAKAAAEFLKDFDWEKYKDERQKNYYTLQSQRVHPNNW